MLSLVPFFPYMPRPDKRSRLNRRTGLNKLLSLVFLFVTTFASTYAQTPGQSLHFDGVDDYVSLPGGVYFSGNMTIEAWVYPRSFGSYARLIDFGNGDFSQAVVLALSKETSGVPLFEVGGQTQRMDANQTLALNQWNHIAVTINGTAGTMYINGVVVATGTFTIPTITRNNCYIGRSQSDQDAYTDAIIDEVRIWSVARTAAQIAEKQSCELNGNETGLVAYYNFNQGTGGGTNTGVTSLTNAVSGGAAGTLNNFALSGSTSNWTAFGAATKCVNCNTFATRTTANGLSNNIINDVFAVGNTVYAATNGGLNISTDGGQTFTKNSALDALARTTGNPSTDYMTGKVNNVYVSGNTIYATVTAGSQNTFIRYLLARSTNGGQTFTTVKNSVYSMPSFFVGGDNILIPGGSGGQYTFSTNGGQSFTDRPSTINSKATFLGVSGTGGKLYIAAGLGFFAPVGGLYVSTDNGQTFTLSSNLSSSVNGNAVYAVNNMIYYAARTGLFISADGGTTFSQRTTANGLGNNMVYGVYAVGNQVYAATGNGLSISTDGGQTFTNYTTANGLAANKINDVYAVGSTIYAATDAGLSVANFAVQTRNPTPTVQVTPNISIAPGQSVTLTAAANNTTYAWSTGSNAQSIIANSTDLYSVTATGQCPGTYAVQVTVLQANAGTSTTQTPLSSTNCPVKLTATNLSGQRFQATGPGGYLFNDAYPGTVTNKEITLTNIRQPGTYTLRSVNASGVTTAVNTFNVTGSGCN